MINYSFLETNQSQLIEIYKKERYMNNGGVEGALILDFRKNDKVDVFYWTIEAMIEQVREVFLVEYKKNLAENDNKKNLVYVVLLDTDNIEVKSYVV
jgi:hypothetical protein